MAKRKRLSGPLQDFLTTSETHSAPASSTAPIARVAGDASVSAALEEVSRELSSARDEGRLVVRLALDTIDAAWLMRDRAHPGTADEPDFSALIDSLRRNGQRNPIEVVDMGAGRYGLISGWRRLTALRCLHDETGDDRFATVLAFLRQPKSSEEAYVAMVEENEIRLGLSYYERARIAAKAVEAGVFPSSKLALQSLFATASRSKRSKIGSFLSLYRVLGDNICFPQALNERLGLALVKALEANERAGAQLIEHLKSACPDSFEAEQRLLSDFVNTVENSTESVRAPSTPPVSEALAPSPDTENSVSNPAEEVCPGIFLSQKGGKLQLSGPAVNPVFRDRLEAWLRKNTDT
ncbi:ParB-like nuclease domain-containing protein [Roseovarius marisflavi]|uniref:ParB-like nuclease domain-containing protein n=1 Tax=Roseovarius marisflavi TaxID=1054996 RepID=A0A1M7CGW0_9RHOB|nr:ParB N-terminal domain-containing protein [Roseovarius marisflavi]SHL66502.1 ParB-like nuclease domain-containing protein [Roseovarius marisflavi]